MKKLTLVLLSSMFFLACAHLNLRTSSSRSANSASSSFNKKVSKKKTTALKDLKSNKKVLLSQEDQLFFELSGWNAKKMNETQIYQKVSEKYRQNDLKAVNALTNLLISKYPFSIHADNALYLTGNLAFVEKKYGMSLEIYNRLLANYPQSNKAVSALFAKGVLFKRMNLLTQADQAFQAVQKKYPGSPEALRSEIERKLIQ